MLPLGRCRRKGSKGWNRCKHAFVHLVLGLYVDESNRFGLLDSEVLLSDVDNASAKLQDFSMSIDRIIAEAEEKGSVDSVPSRSRTVVLLTKELSSALFKHMDEGELGSVVDLSDAYEQLLQSWISPLTSSVPGKVRIGVEKCLRKIAAQLSFASIGVRLGPRPGETDQVDGRHAMNLAALNLPVREKGMTTENSERGKGKSRETSASPRPMLSLPQGGGLMRHSRLLEAALPTPGPTASLHCHSSISSQDHPENAACESLRSLTSLTAQAPLPASLSSLLSHWAVGMDPANYDWDATRRALATVSDTEGTGDEAQVKRRQRMERRLKRQRQDTVDTSSQPQAVGRWDSQPEPVGATQGSSQVTEGLIFPMSQVEPGRYGSRQGTRPKATRRRKHGF